MLLKGFLVLVALRAGYRIEASVAEKGAEFSCPKCRAVVILKKGSVKIHHFAHKPPTDCTWSVGESTAHMKAKTALCDALRQRGLRVELEVEILSSGGDRRADVVVWSKSEMTRYAFELQHQPLSYDDIERRTRAYIDAGVPVMWIGLLGSHAFDDAERVGPNLVFQRYSPRPWEKWVHAFAFKSICYMDDKGQIWIGVFTPHLIEIPFSSHFDADGNEVFTGGGNRVSKRWRVLTLTGPFQIADLTMKLEKRDLWISNNLRLPEGTVMTLVPKTQS